MKQRRCRVIGVDLVDVARAAAFDDRGAVEEFPQQHAAARAVDAREPRDDSAGGERDLLRLAQDAAGGGLRLGGAGLGDP